MPRLYISSGLLAKTINKLQVYTSIHFSQDLKKLESIAARRAGFSMSESVKYRMTRLVSPERYNPAVLNSKRNWRKNL